MSIASTSFLFLFLPAAIGIYFLLPQGKNLLFRNLFLLAVSLFFYAWGEPVFIFILLILILLTWQLGKMAAGRQNTKPGKWAVFLVTVMNIGVLLAFKKACSTFDSWGLLLGKDALPMPLPLGMSFFAFHSIAYVVDIYRGQCKAAPKLLYAALYLSVFFKIQQGPIISYREFEPQIECRKTTLEDFNNGIWRFAVGLGKKMIIAANLMGAVNCIFSSDYSALSLSDAWIGCAVYMICIYFDFSGYSDMAIGLAKIFGFKMPENFNYPYLSTSIAEYWRRWHITLCAWFRDYLYFPLVLGPSVDFRKFLLRHNVSDQTAKTMQNIFVPTCVWIVTALWHGTNWNYTIWGLVNSFAILFEQRIKPLKWKKLDTALRGLGVMLILLLTKPFVCTESFGQAMCYLKTMFAGTGVYAVSAQVNFYFNVYGIFLAIGIAGSFMLFPVLKRKLYANAAPRIQILWQWSEVVFLLATTVLSLAYLFQAGSVVFMYQQ